MSSIEVASADAMDVVDDPKMASSDSSAFLLSTIQQHAVDSAFEQLFGYKWGTHFDLAEPQTRQEQLLCRIIGKRAAANVLHTKSKRVVRAITSRAVAKHTAPVATMPRKRAAPQQANEVSAAPSLPAITTAKHDVVEPAAPSPVPAPAPLASAPAISGGSVDSILKALQEGQSASTIAKTSADWEFFKDQTGLGDKLEEKAEGKDAYLNRQAFLTRVDHRTFELERKDRDKERTKRGK